MKLLLDQNLSHKLLPDLAADFPGSRHVIEEELAKADDNAIWRFAAEQGFVIVTKDADFLNRSLLQGHPPKVVQLRLGNCSTDHIRIVLLRERDVIREFLHNPETSILVLE